MKSFLVCIPILFCTFMFLVCAEAPSKVEKSAKLNLPKELYGIWGYYKYENGIFAMQKTTVFDSSQYGFIIYQDGKFVETNAGFCGAPPITYTTFSGNWEAKRDSLLKINVEDWGGTTIYDFQIISLTETELKFRKVNSRKATNDEAARRELKI